MASIIFQKFVDNAEKLENLGIIIFSSQKQKNQFKNKI